MPRFGLSGDNLTTVAVQQHYNDLEAGLRLFFSPLNPRYASRFLGYTSAEVLSEMNERAQELEKQTVLSLLSSIEAQFRVDYILRCKQKLKDPLSKSLRGVHARRAEKARLDEDILEAWKAAFPEAGALISQLRGAFRMRHWLAHGRYWTPKLGQAYDYAVVSALAEAVDQSLTIER